MLGSHGKTRHRDILKPTFDTVSKTTMDLDQSKKPLTSPRPSSASTWITSKTSLRSLTTEQMNMPMMLPMPKAGTTSNGMNSMVSLRIIPIVLLLWLREKGLQPMAFNDGFYYGDEDDVAFDKDVLISYWSKGWWGYNLASPQYLADKGYKFLNTNGDWYYVLGHRGDQSYPLEKAIQNTETVPFEQLASTKYPDVKLPTSGSMLGIWADEPANEYKEEEVFQVMEAFANHNKDYFKADFTALRKAVATVPTDLAIYTPESRAALAKVLDSLNWNVSRAHQDQVDQEVAALTQALAGLKPITQVGSLAENDVKALVEDKPSLDIVEKELDFDLVERTNPDLAKGERRVIQAGVKGQGLDYVEVSALDQSRKVIATEVAKEPVAEIVEVGTKEVVIPTSPSVEAPVKSDLLVNKVVPDQSTPQVISKAQP